MQTPYFFFKVNRSTNTMELHVVLVRQDECTHLDRVFYKRSDAEAYVNDPSYGEPFTDSWLSQWCDGPSIETVTVE